MPDTVRDHPPVRHRPGDLSAVDAGDPAGAARPPASPAAPPGIRSSSSSSVRGQSW